MLVQETFFPKKRIATTILPASNQSADWFVVSQ